MRLRLVVLLVLVRRSFDSTWWGALHGLFVSLLARVWFGCFADGFFVIYFILFFWDRPWGKRAWAGLVGK
jgi:hypothetical protein